MFNGLFCFVSVPSPTEMSARMAKRAEERGQKRSVEEMLCNQTCTGNPSTNAEVETSQFAAMREKKQEKKNQLMK